MNPTVYQSGPIWPSAYKAGLSYFGLVFAAGFVLGVVRVLVLNALLGRGFAVLVELPIILTVAWFASHWTIIRFQLGSRLLTRLAMGGFAFALLMIAEAGLSMFAFGRSLAEHFNQYRSVSAALGLAGQVVFGLLPMIQARLGRN